MVGFAIWGFARPSETVLRKATCAFRTKLRTRRFAPVPRRSFRRAACRLIARRWTPCSLRKHVTHAEACFRSEDEVAHKKRPRFRGVVSAFYMLVCLSFGHVARLELAVLASRDVELHSRSFVKRLEAVHLDFREMHEEIFAILLRDEAVALFRVEPLNSTFAILNPLSYSPSPRR